MARTGPRSAAILQSCYIPWRGYFDILGSVDVFVVYDDVQYSKNHWHNRNRVKTAQGPTWLTIPVSLPDGVATPIERVEIAKPFAEKHWMTIAQAYARAPHFKDHADRFEALYTESGAFERLSAVNVLFLTEIARGLGFETEIVRSSALAATGDRTGRLLAICREVGADVYLSGPSAKDYLDTDALAAGGVATRWMDYAGYPDYPQRHGAFEPQVSILDLLFNVGPEARRYMKAPLALG